MGLASPQTAASGPVGEVGLDHVQGPLVFDVGIADKNVKVDARDEAIVAVDADD
jgi:uncharacterized membrane protein YkoI